jgi:hypothetical protein
MAEWKSVTSDEFEAWLRAYPGQLERELDERYSPPRITFYDWSISDPRRGGNVNEAIVASYVHDWYAKPPVDRDYQVRVFG